MEGIKRILYLFVGLIGLFLLGITIVIILLQYKTEINLLLNIFCAVSWGLFIFAANQVYSVLPKDDLRKINEPAGIEPVEDNPVNGCNN